MEKKKENQRRESSVNDCGFACMEPLRTNEPKCMIIAFSSSPKARRWFFNTSSFEVLIYFAIFAGYVNLLESFCKNSKKKSCCYPKYTSFKLYI